MVKWGVPNFSIVLPPPVLLRVSTTAADLDGSCCKLSLLSAATKLFVRMSCMSLEATVEWWTGMAMATTENCAATLQTSLQLSTVRAVWHLEQIICACCKVTGAAEACVTIGASAGCRQTVVSHVT